MHRELSKTSNTPTMNPAMALEKSIASGLDRARQVTPRTPIQSHAAKWNIRDFVIESQRALGEPSAAAMFGHSGNYFEPSAVRGAHNVRVPPEKAHRSLEMGPRSIHVRALHSPGGMLYQGASALRLPARQSAETSRSTQSARCFQGFLLSSRSPTHPSSKCAP